MIIDVVYKSRTNFVRKAWVQAYKTDNRIYEAMQQTNMYIIYVYIISIHMSAELGMRSLQ